MSPPVLRLEGVHMKVFAKQQIEIQEPRACYVCARFGEFRVVKALGLCLGHYWRKRRGRELWDAARQAGTGRNTGRVPVEIPRDPVP